MTVPKYPLPYSPADDRLDEALVEVADGHVVHTCCGKLDDAEHRNFCPKYVPGTKGGAR